MSDRARADLVTISSRVRSAGSRSSRRLVVVPDPIAPSPTPDHGNREREMVARFISHYRHGAASRIFGIVFVILLTVIPAKAESSFCPSPSARQRSPLSRDYEGWLGGQRSSSRAKDQAPRPPPHRGPAASGQGLVSARTKVTSLTRLSRGGRFAARPSIAEGAFAVKKPARLSITRPLASQALGALSYIVRWAGAQTWSNQAFIVELSRNCTSGWRNEHAAAKSAIQRAERSRWHSAALGRP